MKITTLVCAGVLTLLSVRQGSPQSAPKKTVKKQFLDCAQGAPLRFDGITVRRGSDNKLVRIDICGAAENELFYFNPADDNADTDVPVVQEPPFPDLK